MPRRSKIDEKHDNVFPLSLPEVQLAVARSMEGDGIDEEAVQHAVRGYQLLLQGSLTNAQSEKTKELKGPGGYYRNAMRGVAQLFGVKQREDLSIQIMKQTNPPLDDVQSYQDIPEEENITRGRKRRKIQTRAINDTDMEGSSQGHEEYQEMRKQRNENADIQHSQNTQEEETEMDATSDGHEEHEEIQDLRNNNADNKTVESARQSASTQSNEGEAGVVKEAPVGDEISPVISKSLLQPPMQYSPKTDVTPPVSKFRPATAPFNRFKKSPRTSSFSSPLARSTGTFRSDIPDQNRSKNSMSMRETQESNHVPKPLESTLKDSKKATETEPSMPASMSPNAITPEGVLEIVEGLDIPDGFKLFTDYETVKLLEEGLLPGTWMSNHKKLKGINFFSPKDCDNYFMLRHNNKGEGPDSSEKGQWQLIYYSDLKSICESLGSGKAIDVWKLATKPSVFIFDSSDLGAENDCLLGIRNFFNGVLRHYHRTVFKVPTPTKEEFDRIKVLVTQISANVVYVKMPQQPTPSFSAAYLLSNINFLRDGQNLKNILEATPEVDNIRKRNVVFGKGRNKISTNVSITVLDAVDSYGPSYVEPIFAL